MAYNNVNIKGIGIYHPQKGFDNEHYINYFKSMGIEVASLLNHLGRKYRYISDGTDTSVTMTYEASKTALEKANISAEVLDMIVFVSDTPEYTSPSNALKLNHLLGAKNAHIVYDMNCNCIGMLTALDQISTYLKGKKNIKYVLLTGSSLISSVVNDKDPITYPGGGDLSAAVVLEVAQEDEERGFIDAKYFTDSNYHDSILMPACGYSNMYKDDIPVDLKKWQWTPFDFSFLPEKWSALIKNLLNQNNLVPSDIDHFLFSQFSKPDTIETLELLEVDCRNFTFVADEFGYTGPTSPILALSRAMEVGRVRKGSKVVLCSVGSGYTMAAVLYKL